MKIAVADIGYVDLLIALPFALRHGARASRALSERLELLQGVTSIACSPEWVDGYIKGDES